MGASMNRVFRFWLTALVFLAVSAGLTVAQSSQQSLGDYARAIKKTKAVPVAPDQKKVYENDNLPTTSSISVVGNAPAADAVPADQAKDANTPTSTATGDDKKDEKKDPEIKAGQTADERKEALDSWKQKLSAQSDKVNGLSHELDLLQREYRVKSAEYYANTANRAQNFEAEEVDPAILKAKLNEMQDDARKAGAPNSVAERQ